MPLTVGELVTRPKLFLELLVAGDLDRELRWIHFSDAGRLIIAAHEAA